jgi:hypothetical protein
VPPSPATQITRVSSPLSWATLAMPLAEAAAEAKVVISVGTP